MEEEVQLVSQVSKQIKLLYPWLGTAVFFPLWDLQ